MRSFVAIGRVDLGFHPQGVLTMSTALSVPKLVGARRYVAFYDSDDLWLPHHLADCVSGLDACPEVDWVFSACRRVEHGSDRVLLANTFYHPDPFVHPTLLSNWLAQGCLSKCKYSQIKV